jgi:acetylornithine deacetylase/succinyl-diaminopimelate desuccinylase-like protein
MVTTINVTVLQGGTSSDGGKTFAPNVIPSDASITADIRVSPTEFRETIEELTKLAKENNLERRTISPPRPSAGRQPVADWAELGRMEASSPGLL